MEIGFAPEIIAGYNENNGTEYEALPAEQLPQGATVTIPAGEISANFQLHIDDFATNGITYAVPLALGNVLKGNVTKSAAQGRFIYVLSKPLNGICSGDEASWFRKCADRSGNRLGCFCRNLHVGNMGAHE